MKYQDAQNIASYLFDQVKGACEVGNLLVQYQVPLCTIAGSLRRDKPEVHDIEIVASPSLKTPRPEFGKQIYKTEFDKKLAALEESGHLRFVMGGDKLKKYEVVMSAFGLPPTLNPFHVEFYLCTPPAQYGVLLTIRTGPAKDNDNFSKWMVTQKELGGALPDGYRVKHGAVWKEDQLDARQEPIKGQTPLHMPDELDFFKFCQVKWVSPQHRHALWRITK